MGIIQEPTRLCFYRIFTVSTGLISTFILFLSLKNTKNISIYHLNFLYLNMQKFNSLIQLLDHFKDENTCKEYLAHQRWNGNVTCPHCKHTKVYATNRGYKCANTEC